MESPGGLFYPGLHGAEMIFRRYTAHTDYDSPWDTPHLRITLKGFSTFLGSRLAINNAYITA